MAPQLTELLAEERRQRESVSVPFVQVKNGRVQLIDPNPAPLAVVPPASELKMDDDGDPFNGNLNNRRVAERIASERKYKQYLNNSEPTHTGDPKKALDDIARSKALVPDPLVKTDDDPMPPIALPSLPTPGSPAAVKAAADKKTTKVTTLGPPATPAPAASTPPPTWKPNA